MGFDILRPSSLNYLKRRIELVFTRAKEFLFDEIADDPQSGLDQEQKIVLAMVSYKGSAVVCVRDKAKKVGVGRPLSVIKVLIELGFLELSRSNDGESVVVRIR